MPLLRSQKFRRLLFSGLIFFVLFGCLATVWYCWRVAHILTHKERQAVIGSPDDWGVETWSAVTITTTDGLRLDGWYIPPAPDADGAAVLLVHGHGGSRLDYVNIAPFLMREGYGLLMFDLRASGTSEGELVTMGCHEVMDVEAAFAYLVTRPEVDAERIGIFGHSMGGATAIRAMARIPQARVLIASAAYTSVYTSIGDGIQRLTPLPSFPIADLIVQMASWQADCDLSEVRPIEDITTISPRPVLLIHGRLDNTVEAHHSDDLFAAAREPKQLYMVESAGHGDVYETDPAEYERRVLDFLSEYLRGDYPNVDN